MPLSRYDSAFGGKRGSARKALSAMVREYGEKKGTSVFYATKNRNVNRKKRRPLHEAVSRSSRR